MKLFFKIFLILLFLGLIPLSCRKVKYPYYRIDVIQLGVCKDYNVVLPLDSSDSLTTDSAFVNIFYNTITVAETRTNFNLFTSSAYAFKKPFDGYKGLKHKISTISITSNKLYNSRSAGSELNDLMCYATYKKTHTINEIKNEFNDGKQGFPSGQSEYPHRFILKRPTDSLNHKFKIEYSFEDGSKVYSIANIIWK